MSIASELNALNGYILGAYDEINTKGGTVPTNKNMANLASAIASISGGGGGGGTIASGSFTTDANTAELTHTITHGLGTLPKVFFCASTHPNNFSSSKNTYASKYYICITHYDSSEKSGVLYQVAGASAGYASILTDSVLATGNTSGTYYFNMDSQTATIKAQGNTTYGLGKDVEFYWVAVAG